MKKSDGALRTLERGGISTAKLECPIPKDIDAALAAVYKHVRQSLSEPFVHCGMMGLFDEEPDYASLSDNGSPDRVRFTGPPVSSGTVAG